MNRKAKDRQTNFITGSAFLWLGAVLLAGGCKTGTDISEMQLTLQERKVMVERMCASLLADKALRPKGKGVVAIRPFRSSGQKEMVDAESLQWIASEIGTCLRGSRAFDVLNGAVATSDAPTYILSGELSCEQDGGSCTYCLTLHVVNAADGQACWCDSVELRKSIGD